MKMRLRQVEPAVGVKNRSGDVGGVFSKQERDNRSHILPCSNALEWDFPLSLRSFLIGIPSKDVGVNIARSEYIDAFTFRADCKCK
jgi:hypothetical protein